MKFLKEAYGESLELDDFVYLQNNRFSKYYIVTLVVDGKASNNYFAFEDAAKDYYDSLIKEIKEDKDYYDNTQLTLSKVELNPNIDEVQSFDTRLEDEE